MTARADFYYSGVHVASPYKRSLWRRIRDTFDDTVVHPSKKMKLQKYVINKQKEIYNNKNNFIVAKTVEDYSLIPTENADVIIPEIVNHQVQNLPAVVKKRSYNIQTINVAIPIWKPVIYRKEVKIVLPRLKMNKGNLRKLGWLSVITAMAILFDLSSI